VSITGGSVINTAPRMKLRSVPKASVNRYLDLYVLTRKRTKLELELQALLKRKKTITDDLKDLAAEIRKVEMTVSREDRKKNCRGVAVKGAKDAMRTIVLEY